MSITHFSLIEMSRQALRQLFIPIEGALDGLTLMELEILHNRLKSKNYRPTSSSTSIPSPSLFDDRELVASMVPTHMKITEQKVAYQLQKEAKHIEQLRIDRANRFLSPLPRLPDELDVDDFDGEVGAKAAPFSSSSTPKEKALLLRGRRISSEIEKKLVGLFGQESLKAKLQISPDCWISKVECNFELTVAKIFFSLTFPSDWKEIVEGRVEEMVNERMKLFEVNSKAIRFLIAKHVYLKRVPELEFLFDRESLSRLIKE